MTRIRPLRAALALCAAAGLLTGAAPPLAAQAAGSIRGVVRNVDDNTPIVRASVTIDALGMRAFTNEDGRYQLNNVPAGLHSVTARFLGFAPGLRDSVLVRAGQTVWPISRCARRRSPCRRSWSRASAKQPAGPGSRSRWQV